MARGFMNLRDRLDRAGFEGDLLGPENASLVENLLETVERLGGELNEAKSREMRHMQDAKSSSEDAFSLKRENARLMKENNDLHLHSIKEKEKLAADSRGWEMTISRLEGELADSKFVCGQQQAALQQKETEIIRLRASLTGQMESEVAAALAEAQAETVAQANAQDAAARSALEERAADLEADLQRANDKLEIMTRKIGVREAEIARLGALAASGRVSGRRGDAAVQSANQANKDAMEHLYNQIEFLNSQVARYEKSLEASNEEKSKLEHELRRLDRGDKDLSRAVQRTEKLEGEMNRLRQAFSINIGEIITEYASDDSVDSAKLILAAREAEKEASSATIQELESEIASAREDAKSQLEKNKAVVMQVARAQADAARLQGERDRLSKSLTRLQADITALRREATQGKQSDHQLLIETETLRTNAERSGKDLASLRSKLGAAENALLRANEKIHALNATAERDGARISAAEGNATETARIIRSLTDERDRLRNEVEVLNEKDAANRRTVESLKATGSETRAESERAVSRGRMLEDEVQSLTDKLSRRNEDVKRHAGENAQLQELSDLPSVVREQQLQLNRWRERAADLDVESRRAARERENERGRVAQLLQERIEMDAALRNAREQREEVVNECRILKRDLEDAKVHIRGVEADREHLSKLHKEATVLLAKHSEMQSLSQSEVDRAKLEAQKAHAHSSAVERKINALLDQADTTKHIVSQLQDEQFKLKDALNVSQQEALRLRGDLSLRSKELESARQELEASIQERKLCGERLSDVLKQLEADRTARSEADESMVGLRLQLAEAQSNCNSFKSKSDSASHLLENLRGETRALHERLAVVSEEARGQSEKCAHLQRVISQHEKRREEIEKELDEARNGCLQLEDAVMTQERRFRELEQEMGASKRQLNAQSEILGVKEEQAKDLERKLQKVGEELRFAEESARLKDSELGAASQDLANMTRENQAVNAACHSLRVERDRLRAQLGETTSRASRLDGLLESAKLEKADLLSVYRRVCDENARVKRMTQELASARAKTMTVLHAKEDGASRDRRRMAELEDTVRRQKVDLQAYERQLSELSRQIQGVQSKASLASEAKDTMQRRAISAREASQTMLEQQKGLRWELGQARAEAGAISGRMKRLQFENQALLHELSEERRKVAALEHIVSSTRQNHAELLAIDQGQLNARALMREVKEFTNSPGSSSKGSPVTQARSESGISAPASSGVHETRSEGGVVRLHRTGSADIILTKGGHANVHISRTGAKSSASSPPPPDTVLSPATSSSSGRDSKTSRSSDLTRRCEELENMIHDQTNLIRQIQRDRDAGFSP